MRLRTFEPFGLLKNGILYSYPSLQKNIDAEIAVIGGGITGALTSHALVEKGYKVVLIDKRDIGMGSTAATTSMLQYEIDVPLYQLAEMIGEEAAVACYRAGIAAIHNLKTLVDELNLDCGYQEKQSLYIAHNMRTTDDGRLLIGGEDSSANIPFFQQRIKERKAKKLKKKIEKILPGINFLD